MKKQFVFVLVAVMTTAFVQAQLSVGLKAGVNLSAEKYSNTFYSTSRHAFFTVGGFGAYQISKPFAAEIGLHYSAEGTNETYNSNGSKVTGTVTITRLNIPLLFRYHSPFGVYAETGPQFGLLLSAKGKYSTGSYDFKPYTQSFLPSWWIGLGYRFEKGAPGLGINIGYAKGLANVNKGTVSGGTITANTISIRLVYAYQFKTKK